MGCPMARLCQLAAVIARRRQLRGSRNWLQMSTKIWYYSIGVENSISSVL